MVTEHEMKEFFQQVVDQVATLSTQAQRVEGLEQRINELTQRLSEAETKNYDLGVQLNQATSRISDLEDSNNHVRRELDNEKAVTQSLRDTLIQRDSKVAEVEHNNEAERSAHRITLSERDDARRRSDELDEQVSSFRNQLEEVSRERTHWKDEAIRSQNEVNDLKQKLTRVQSILAPLQAISADVSAVG